MRKIGDLIKGGGLLLVFTLGGVYTAGAQSNYTTQATFIKVPQSAMGLTNGQTSATTSNTIQINATVYIPNDVTSPAPVILVLHGFGDDKDYSKTVTLARDFANAGFVVLAPSLRGFGDSGGLVTLAGPNEVNDLVTIILAMQTGTIGQDPPISIPVTSASKFGVTGISYGGGLSWEMSRTQVPGLAAVMPIIGWTDLYQALAPNNVPKLSFTAGLFATGYNVEDPNYAPFMFDWLGDFLGGHPEKTEGGDPETNVNWRSVIFTPDAALVPVFAIQGWQDYLFPSEQAITMLQSTNNIPFFKLYIGGLGHPPASSDINGPEALYMRGQAVRWFTQWLTTNNTGILDEPTVTLAPDNTEDWSTNALVMADTFPLPGTTTNTLYINLTTLTTTEAGPLKPKGLGVTSGAFGFLNPLLRTIGINSDATIDDVISVSAILNDNASDVLDVGIFTQLDTGANRIHFNSAPLANDLWVLGNPVYQLYVSSKNKNDYYYVQLAEETPKGKVTLVTRGAFKDTTEDPTLPHLIQFSPFGINHVFAAGNMIKLLVASRDYPFFIPNLNQSTAMIYRDPTYPSNVELPIAP
jgi:predicted acyl esterase